MLQLKAQSGCSRVLTVFMVTGVTGILSLAGQCQTTPATKPPIVTPSNVMSGPADEAKPADQSKTDQVQNNQGSANQAQKLGGAGVDGAIRLGPGDLVEIGVYNVPELASKARVDGNGDLYLPLIDYVHVEGLTLDEAQRVVEKKLDEGGFVKSPHVSIFVDEYASQGVSVLGEVMKPGIYPVLGKQQLLDLISSAGGLTEKAGRVVTVTHRNQPDQPVTVELAKNFSDTTRTNIDISPGDTIVIHKADVIYVVGDVAKPSGLLIDRENLTVLQALALAGGTTSTSRPNGSRIIHKGPDGMTETPVPLKKILQAKAPDMPMKPDDILFVPSSIFKTTIHDNASIAVQASSLALVAVK